MKLLNKRLDTQQKKQEVKNKFNVMVNENIVPQRITTEGRLLVLEDKEKEMECSIYENYFFFLNSQMG